MVTEPSEIENSFNPLLSRFHNPLPSIVDRWLPSISEGIATVCDVPSGLTTIYFSIYEATILLPDIDTFDGADFSITDIARLVGSSPIFI